MTNQMKLRLKNNYRNIKQDIRDKAKFNAQNDTKHEIVQYQTFNRPTAGTHSYREGHFKDNARIRTEQNNNDDLRNLRNKLEGQQYNETQLNSDYRYKHHLQNLPKIEIRQDIIAPR